MIIALMILQILLLLFGLAYLFALGYGVLFGAPFVGTRRPIADKMVSFARINPNDIVLDLGCGKGDVLAAVARHSKAVRLVGYEINPLLALIARMRLAHVSAPTRIYTKNVLRMGSHEDVTVVFLYLLPQLMDRLLPQLCESLPSHARIISHGFEFSNLTPKETLAIHNATLHLYEMSDVMAHSYERGNNS